MILWGGASGMARTTPHGDGAAFDPSTRSWRMLAPSPLPASQEVTAVWDGSEMVVFDQTQDDNGLGSDRSLAIGAYDPVADTWRMLDRLPLQAGRTLDDVQAVAAGSKVLVFASWSQVTHIDPKLGFSGVNGLDMYWLDPASESWSPLAQPEPGVSQVRDPVWTGSGLVADFNTQCPLCVGNKRSGTAINETYRFDSVTGEWEHVSLLPDSVNGEPHVWTGRSLVKFGYQGASGDPGAPSGAWDPVTQRWTAVPGPPSTVRAFWTGSTVIVIGGTRLDPGTLDDVFSAYRFVPSS